MTLNKNILIIIILFSFAIAGVAQGGFRKKYYLQNSLTSVCNNAIEAPNGNLILIGLTYDTLKNHSYNRLTIIITNSLGVVLSRKDYGDSKFEYLDGFGKGSTNIDGSFFYVTLCVKDSTNKQLGVLMKFDFNGDTIWQRTYQGSGFNDVIPQSLTKSIDNGFLLTGASQDASGQLCLVLKTDINGNELWRKRISKAAPNVQYGIAIKQDSATKKIFITGYQYIGNSNSWDTYSNILILDSLGNKLIQTTFNNAGGSGFGELIQLKDKNFMTCGAWKALEKGNTTYYKSLIVKFDVNGNIIWSKLFELMSPYNSIEILNELPNQDIVMLGRADSLYPSTSFLKPEIFKMDKHGNLKWKREIGIAYSTYKYSQENGASMNSIQNGGFIIASRFPYFSIPHPYSIIKIDSTGCDTTEAYCLSVVLGIDKLHELRGWSFDLFPNPASDVVNIKIEAFVEEVFTLKITDISGRELEKLELEPNTELKLNTTSYKSGVYFVTVFHKQKALETKRLLIGH